MAALLISWMFAGWMSLVFGLAGAKFLTSHLREDRRTVDGLGADYVVLFGFILITSLAAVVSIFSPINGYTTGVFALAGAALTVFLREDLKQTLQKTIEGWRSMPWPLKMAVITVFFLAMCSIVIEFGEHDVWFYHAQSIQWIKKYAVVPGLGNLHGRFAFNSHFFISTALFSCWFSQEYVVFPLMSFFFFLFSVRLLINMQTGLTAGRHAYFLLNTLLALTCIFQIFPETNGVSTDGISAILLIYAFLLFLEPAFVPAKISGLLLFWLLILTAITFKLSSVYAGLILVFTLPRIFRNKRVFLFLGAAGLVLLPFVVREIILSGYLLYPVPEMDFLSVDWKIPIKEVILEKELIEGWAKLPSNAPDMAIEDIPKILSVPFGAWFEQWWPATSLKWKAVMLIDLFIAVLLIAALYRKNYRLAILCFTLAFNMVFWFLTAPKPRFGFAFLYMGMALVLGYGLAPILKYIKLNNYIFAFFSVLMFAFLGLKRQVLYTENPKLSLLLIPDYFQVRSEPEVFQTKNFTVNTPPAAPPARGIWCYNLPIPCTPFPKKNLVMRGKSYQSGFKVLEE